MTPADRPSIVYLPVGPWGSVLDCLCERFPAIERARWMDRIARGRVLGADGAPIDTHTPYRAGMLIRYFREVPDEPPIPFVERVLHVDEHLVVADKPHFLPVTPVGRFVRETLLTRLVERLGNSELAPLHRIDRDTAGLVLFSANPATRSIYQALFRERAIEKRYEALAAPLPGVEFPLRYRSRLVTGEPFFRTQEVPGEPNSETRIEVIERGEHDWRYALYPLSGRKHQLRVQMAALGAPIRNDPLYPQLREAAPDDPAAPLRLLAQGLRFVDPLGGAVREFRSTFTI